MDEINVGGIARQNEEWYNILLHQGYDALIMEVMSEENKIFDQQVEEKVETIRAMLATVPMELLIALVSGNLAKAADTNVELREILAYNKVHSKMAPAIYYQSLVNEETKESLSANEAKKVVAGCLKYLRTGNTANEFAKLVDTAYHSQMRQKYHRHDNGYRQYLCHKDHVGLGTPEKQAEYTLDPDKFDARHQIREENLKAQLYCLLERLSSIPAEDGDEPLEIPLGEVGYAGHATERLKQHAKHTTSSNYLMNLWEAVCKVLYGQDVLQSSFRIHQYVIFTCYIPSHAILGETFFTRLAHGYIYNGGGFSHYHAGLSNESVKDSEKVKWDWDGLCSYAVIKTCFDQNWDLELEKQKAAIDAEFQETAKERAQHEQDLAEEEAYDADQAGEQAFRIWLANKRLQEAGRHMSLFDEA
jgi:hypothetical protein